MPACHSSFAPKRTSRCNLVATIAAGLLFAGGPAWGQNLSSTALKKLSLEELMDLEVVSVSRRPEKLSETASAVRVVTGEDIRRSGAAVLPQALRLASNVQAAQVSASYWTISTRGMNATGTTSNKLLVMVDGRSVYRQLVSGTYWDSQDIFLPDVDRIEVVSGPGGSTWGANAVNGVINILTKSAAETQGTLIYGGAGGEERGLFGVRHGGRVGNQGHFRVYAKYTDLDGTVRPGGIPVQNHWTFGQIGFRADLAPQPRAELMVSGDLYDGGITQPNFPRGEFGGGNLVARWTQSLALDARLLVKAFYDSAERGAPNTFADRMDTLDLDVQHDFVAWERHRLVSGVSYRHTQDSVRNLPTQAFIPAKFTHRLFGAFLHDELQLVPNRLRLMLGYKFENNNYSGSDHQPSVRLAWLATPDQTIWTAISKAVRTPSRADRDLYIPPQAPFTLAGGAGFGSEKLTAYELGWRGAITHKATGAVSFFYHDYDGLKTLEQPIPLTFGNGLDAKTHGAEVFLRYEPVPWLDLTAGYTLLKKSFRFKSWSRDFNTVPLEQSDPEDQVQVRAAIDLPGGWEVDAGYRYVGRVPTVAARVVSFVPAYRELDARIGWVSRNGLEISIVGSNLLHRSHPETGPVNNRREIERSVHGRFILRY
jgi:iron complex outermembrane receptor protein